MGRACCSSSPPPVAMAAAWLLSLALLTACASALTREEFYPFGAANGDITMTKCYACSTDLVPLPSAVPVFGVTSVRGVYVNSNGAVHFRKPFGYGGGFPREFPPLDPSLREDGLSMVAGFWADLFNDCPDCGETTYRTVNDAAVLAGISTDVREAFPTEQLAAGFSATSAVIATWNNTARCCSGEATPESETFQIVIAFDTDTTFIFLMYADDAPETANSSSYEIYAQAGFNVGDYVRGYSLPGALTAAVGNATRKSSNIGQPGKWCFGLSANETIGAVAHAGGPYTVDACDASSSTSSSSLQLQAYGGYDACGQQRTLAWDLDNDGEFDDEVGPIPLYEPYPRPGVYTIRAQASSPSPCAGSPVDPVVLSATVTVTGTVPVIMRLYTNTQTGNNEAYVGERFVVRANYDAIDCLPSRLTIHCGPGNVATPKGGNACQYNSAGEKRITATLEQDGFVASAELVITVTTISINGPLEMEVCGDVTVTAGVGLDACGNQRILNWDFDSDGAFDDASRSSVSLRHDILRLPAGTYTISVEAISSPSCPATPREVRSTTLNIIATPPVINGLRASTFSGGPNATIGESVRILTSARAQACVPSTLTVDCGLDNVGDSGAGVCRYNSTGVKVITVTLEQFGFVASRSVSITVVGFIMGGPYRADICSTLRLTAVASVDACGQARSLAWDLDDDGVFDDASGRDPRFRPYDQGLGLGVHVIRVRAATSSSSSCPESSPPEVVGTTVTVTTPRLVIRSITPTPVSGLGRVASVAERIRVIVDSTRALCAPRDFAMNCGADSVGKEAGYCRYRSPGQKTITVTIAQFGAVASLSRNITVTTYNMGGPYRVAPCSSVRLAAPVTIDACGRQRVLAWDFDNDGAFDDATGGSPTLNPASVLLAPGVHPIRVRLSSSPTCAASPTAMFGSTNVTVTAGDKLEISGILTIPVSGNGVASTGEDIGIYVLKSYIYCLPSTLIVDCGADSVFREYDGADGICRYSTPGQRVITATLTQSGVSVSSARNITITAYSIGGPYRVPLCGSVTVAATAGLDECGNTYNLAWDFDGDGAFDDATRPRPVFSSRALRLFPGVYPISVRFSSNSCPGAVPVILTTNVTVTGPIPPPRLVSASGVPESANVRANVGEAIQVDLKYAVARCIPYNLTIDCGPDHVGNTTGYCKYDTTGIKLITVTLSQEGVEVSRRFNMTVISIAPSCTTLAFPEGRVRGRQGCPSSYWSTMRCNYPKNIKPYTKLYNAFASRAPEDARRIEHLFGNRTVAQTLNTPYNLVDNLAREATVALLNAATVYYAQCPLAVKLDFRHSLYNASNFTRLNTLRIKFFNQNSARYGCPLRGCSG